MSANWPFLLLVFLLPFGTSNKEAEPMWDLIKHEEDIRVYTRNNTISEIKEIRITLTVKSTMDKIVDVLSDVPLYTDWVYKCSISNKIISKSKNEFYYYVVTDLPSPFDDRDLIVHSKHWIDQTTGIFHSKSMADNKLVKEKEDYVRITNFVSSWEVKPLGNDLFYIEYQAQSNPAGNIPVWLINMAIAKGPYETMTAFKKLVITP
ncbi:MAG: START domain-containing protein [Cyclobacteriaceae bacterium]|nr:START domain-containing protein [Cyclobacteriaceae bacterium]